ncbi:MAG: hypothetical protein ABSA33_03270 [Candidatus Micrarchaeaceae archaeon]|jgi:hypothetical protein
MFNKFKKKPTTIWDQIADIPSASTQVTRRQADFAFAAALLQLKFRIEKLEHENRQRISSGGQNDHQET